MLYLNDSFLSQVLLYVTCEQVEHALQIQNMYKTLKKAKII